MINIVFCTERNQSEGCFHLRHCNKWNLKCLTWSCSRVYSQATQGSKINVLKASNLMSSLREKWSEFPEKSLLGEIRRGGWRWVQWMQQFKTRIAKKHSNPTELEGTTLVFIYSVPYGGIYEETVGKIQRASQLYYGDFSLQNIFWKHAQRSQMPASVTA